MVAASASVGAFADRLYAQGQETVQSISERVFSTRSEATDGDNN